MRGQPGTGRNLWSEQNTCSSVQVSIRCGTQPSMIRTANAPGRGWLSKGRLGTDWGSEQMSTSKIHWQRKMLHVWKGRNIKLIKPDSCSITLQLKVPV